MCFAWNLVCLVIPICGTKLKHLPGSMLLPPSYLILPPPHISLPLSLESCCPPTGELAVGTQSQAPAALRVLLSLCLSGTRKHMAQPFSLSYPSRVLAVGISFSLCTGTNRNVTYRFSVKGVWRIPLCMCGCWAYIHA